VVSLSAHSDSENVLAALLLWSDATDDMPAGGPYAGDDGDDGDDGDGIAAGLAGDDLNWGARSVESGSGGCVSRSVESGICSEGDGWVSGLPVSIIYPTRCRSGGVYGVFVVYFVYGVYLSHRVVQSAMSII